MFLINFRIKNPVAGNTTLTPKELKYITDSFKKNYREPFFNGPDNVKISAYQLQLFYSYLYVINDDAIKRYGKEDEYTIYSKDTVDILFKSYYEQTYIAFLRVILRISNPMQKYYGVKFDIYPSGKIKPEFFSEIYVSKTKKRMVELDGKMRPIYRMASIEVIEPYIHWQTVDTCLLKEHYNGDQKELKLYIQFHTIIRMKERLDILDQGDINQLLIEGIKKMEPFEVYKNHLLLPVVIANKKIGYWLVSIIEDYLLLRTFLLISQNNTPEGDKLQELSGLIKEDMKYWQMDRLSTFIELNKEENPILTQLLKDAGLESLLQIDKNLVEMDLAENQNNLEGLEKYIQQGLQAIKGYNEEEIQH